jgi:hypothetical protein
MASTTNYGAGTYSRVLNSAVNVEKTTKIEIANVINLDTILNNYLEKIDNKSDVGHTHTTADITDYSSALDNKANKIHTHKISDILNSDTDTLQIELDAKVLKTDFETYKAEINTSLGLKANTSDVATTVQLTALGNSIETKLAKKSDDGHIHAESDITNLVSDLAKKSPIGHTHAISDVTNLTSTLNSKSNNGHTHTTSDITDYSNALALKADQTEVESLKTSKAEVQHTHTTIDLTDFATVYNLGTISGNFIITSASSHFMKVTLTGDTLFTINVPNTNAYSFTLNLINAGIYNVTWDSKITWLGGVVPVLQKSGNSLIYFQTLDKGVSWLGSDMLGGASSSIVITYN